MTNEELTIELQRAYRCIQGLHSLQTVKPTAPLFLYHAPTIAAAKRFVFEGELDGSSYFIGKDASILVAALHLSHTVSGEKT